MQVRKIIFTFFAVFIYSTAVSQNGKDEIKVIETLMYKQQVDWNNGDIKGFMDYYWNSDSLKFIGSKGITYGWQKTLDNYIKSYPNKEAMGILKFTILESTQLSKTSIYVIGKWELQKEKPSGGHFTLLWKKINSKWVIVADHTS
jgi:ketosteroid isomerase-like protein